MERLSGRYLLKHKIGEGGMGTVHVAYDAELDRDVAVKMLAANLVNDAEVMERFEREARLRQSSTTRTSCPSTTWAGTRGGRSS